jgi:hypothetical protein
MAELAAAFGVAECSGAGVLTGYAGFFAGYQRTSPGRASGVGFGAALNSIHFGGIEVGDGFFTKSQFFVKFFGPHICFLLFGEII